jgi:hypothetical protein
MAEIEARLQYEEISATVSQSSADFSDAINIHLATTSPFGHRTPTLFPSRCIHFMKKQASGHFGWLNPSMLQSRSRYYTISRYHSSHLRENA